MGQENIDRLWTLLSAVSKDASKAAKKKCVEKEFDTQKGIVDLDESLTNLSHIRDVLKDAVENKKLIQFPYSFQVDVEKKLSGVAKLLKDLSDGTDTVEPLVLEIDQLYYLIWQSRLENVSQDFLGYQEKINKIKALELELERLKMEIETGLALKEEIHKLKTAMEANAIAIEKSMATVTENTKKAADGAAAVFASQQDSVVKMTTVNNTVANIEKALQNSKAHELNVGSITKNIQEFHALIEENKKKIVDVRTAAETVVVSTNADAKALAEKLTKDTAALATKLTASADESSKALNARAGKILSETETRNKTILTDLEKREGEIKDQMAKVTGLGLFHAFRTRMDSIVISKYLWGAGVAVVLVLIALLTNDIATKFSAVNPSFLLKLSIFLPLLAGIVFCITNYGHERQLEEEYAFKSSISLSLVPYKELVEKSTGDKEKYADFLIKAIDNVFTSPTDKVFMHSKEDKASKIENR